MESEGTWVFTKWEQVWVTDSRDTEETEGE